MAGVVERERRVADVAEQFWKVGIDESHRRAAELFDAAFRAIAVWVAHKLGLTDVDLQKSPERADRCAARQRGRIKELQDESGAAGAKKPEKGPCDQQVAGKGVHYNIRWRTLRIKGGNERRMYGLRQCGLSSRSYNGRTLHRQLCSSAKEKSA